MAKLNIDNEEWLIEEGILKVYRGTSRDITIPEGVTEIDDDVFCNFGLKSIILPKSLKKIGNCAFFDNNIKELIIPEGVVEIGNSAFYNNKISQLALPSTLKCIGTLAFGCNKLEAIKIPPQFNFFDSFNLFQIKYIVFSTLPNTEEYSKITELMKEYPDIAFEYYDMTTTIDLKSGLTSYLNNEEWLIMNGVLKEYKGNSSVVVIPEGVEVIDTYSFINKTVHEVKFPSTLKKIENSAFRCTCLSKIELPEGLIEINAFAFESCNLTEVKFPKTLKKIGWHAFEANKLSAITLPEGITFIDDRAFDFNLIQELTIYNFIKSNLKNAFNTKKTIILNLMKKPNKEELEYLSNIDFANLKTVNIYFEPTLTEMLKLKIIFRKAKIVTKSLTEEVQPTNFINDDKEIDEILKKINDFALVLQPNDKENLNGYIKKLLDKYHKDLENSCPKFSLNNQDINLNTDITDPRALKNNLLIALNRILNKLTKNEDCRLLMVLIKECLNLISNKDIEMPQSIINLESKIKYLIYILNKYSFKSSLNKLTNILNDTASLISKEISQSYSSEANLILEKDITSNFKSEIDKLLEKVNQSIVLMESLNTEGNTLLAEDLRKISQIIDYLDDENKKTYTNLLNSIKNKYQNKLETTDNINQIDFVLAFRRELHQILEELANIIPNIMSSKEILNDLNNTLAFINNKEINITERNGVIFSLVLDIINTSSNPNISDEIKETINKSINEILTKWINILLTTNLNEVEIDLALEHSLSKNLLVILSILKELTSIKLNLESYIFQKEEYSRILKNNKKL